jgi:excisionase family DNA binding protein
LCASWRGKPLANGPNDSQKPITQSHFGPVREAVMTSGTEYFRAADIARLMEISIRTVRRWIAEETLPSLRLGGVRLVPKKALERMLSPARNGRRPTKKYNKYRGLDQYRESITQVIVPSIL